jgi:hypothetical protein
MRQSCTSGYVDGTSTSYGRRGGWDCRGLRDVECLVSRAVDAGVRRGADAGMGRRLSGALAVTDYYRVLTRGSRANRGRAVSRCRG